MPRRRWPGIRVAMRSRKKARSVTSWTVDSFYRGLLRVLTKRYEDDVAKVDRSDLRRWASQVWPLPPEAALNIVEWAQAYLAEQRAKGRATGRGTKQG